MIHKLNLVTELLNHGRRLHECGQFTQAARTLKKLVAFRDLPADIAEEAQSRLADIQFRQGQFVRARRHLRAALAHQPNNADYCHRLAVALDEDPHADPLRALNHFKRCLKLEPKNPHYWCDFAYASINADLKEQGLKALRKAHRLAPDDAEVLSIVVHGLNNEGCQEEARQLLKAARFRNPRDCRFKGLWNRFQFDILFKRQQQQQQQAATPEVKTAIAMVLPFTANRETKLGAKTFRLDGPATLKGPAVSMPKRKRSSKKSD